MFIDSDIDFSLIEHSLVKFNKFKIYDKKVTKTDCIDIRKKIEKLKSLNKNDNINNKIVAIIVHKDSIVAIADTTLDDFNMNVFCNYIKCNKEYDDLRVIIYKIEESNKNDLLKTVYKNVTFDAILVEKIKEKKYLFLFIIPLLIAFLSIALLYYGIPFDIVDMSSIAKMFFIIISNDPRIITLFLLLLIFFIISTFIHIIDKKGDNSSKSSSFWLIISFVSLLIKLFFNINIFLYLSLIIYIYSFFIVYIAIKKDNNYKLLIWLHIIYLILIVILFNNSIPILSLTITIITMFVFLLYVLSKPFTPLDKYHIYNIKSINIGLIIFLAIVYLFTFAIFPFPTMRQKVFTSYLNATGYPKLLTDNKTNKTYYLAYEKRGKLYVYDINKSSCKLKKDLNLNSFDENNNINYVCFTNFCVKSFFPAEQHIIYDIKDKNISIESFNEKTLLDLENNATNCNKTKKDKK